MKQEDSLRPLTQPERDCDEIRVTSRSLAEYRVLTTVESSAVPEELKNKNRWVRWRFMWRDGKRTKVPINPKTGNYASVSDPSTWTDFKTASRMPFHGVGLVLTKEDGLVAWDLDHCRDNETGTIADWAQTIINTMNSYTEVSPSRNGIRILAWGTLPEGVGSKKKGNVEVYAYGKYVTITGQRVPGTPATIEERKEQILKLYQQHFPGSASKKIQPPLARPNNLDDAALLEKMFASKQGDKIRSLFNGDWSGFSSQSEDDLSLCSFLAFWTGRDVSRMDALFRQSGLMRPKWDEKHSAEGRTYGEMTVAQACLNCMENYNMKPQEPVPSFCPLSAPEFLSKLSTSLDASLEFTLEKYLFPGTLNVFSAKPKNGKSTLAYELATKLAQGVPFLGYQTRKGPVFILACEEHPRDIGARLQHLGANELQNLYIHSEPLPFGPETFGVVKTFIQEHNIRLFIIDSLSTFWTVVDENDASEVTRALKPLLSLARETGVCILMVHHSRKAGGQHGDDIRGSSAIFAAVDLALTLHRHEVPTQRVLKADGRYPGTPHELIIDWVDGHYRVVGDQYTAVRQSKRDRVKGVLTQMPQHSKEIARAVQVSPQAVRGMLDDLVQSGEAIRTGSGRKNDPFRYTLQQIPITTSTCGGGTLNERKAIPASEVESPQSAGGSVTRIPIRVGQKPYGGKRKTKISVRRVTLRVPLVLPA